jgi:hypothetical protein
MRSLIPTGTCSSSAKRIPGKARRHRLGRLYCTLGHLPISKDLLLYTPEEVETWRGTRNHVIAQALREGRIVYERAS